VRPGEELVARQCCEVRVVVLALVVVVLLVVLPALAPRRTSRRGGGGAGGIGAVACIGSSGGRGERRACAYTAAARSNCQACDAWVPENVRSSNLRPRGLVTREG
jgi:hypothetical protein